jgi:hypothetical protein
VIRKKEFSSNVVERPDSFELFLNKSVSLSAGLQLQMQSILAYKRRPRQNKVIGNLLFADYS